VITGCTFLGRHARYTVQAIGQQLIVSSTDWTPAQHMNVGETARLGWARDDAQVLSDADDSVTA
jgi:hypothetical protein